MHALRVRLFLIVLFLLVSGAWGPVASQDATPTPAEVRIVPPGESYGGATQGEWLARWWQWTISFPTEINPNIEGSSEKCGYGQSGPVFFIPGEFSGEPVELTCVVPEGMAILVSAGGAGCTTVEPPPYFGRNQTELEECARLQTDMLVDFSITIDGEEVPNLEEYRVTTPLFTMTFPEGNFYEIEPVTALSIAEGYDIIIEPLPPGEYEIGYSTLFEGETEPWVGTMTILVVAPEIIEPVASPAATPAS
jgi:hypothetical protein